MINSRRQRRADELRYQYNRKDSPNISSDRKHYRKRENYDLLPDLTLREMHVNRRQHGHREERPNSTAPFSNLEIEAVICSGECRAERLNFQSNKIR